MGKYQRDKGARCEREFVNLHKEQGIDARRIPLSGSMVGYKNDVVIKGMEGECKVRGDGFKNIYAWLENQNPDFLAIKADNKEWLVVLPLKTWLPMLKSVDYPGASDE